MSERWWSFKGGYYVFYMLVGFAVPLGLAIGLVWGVVYGGIRGVVLSYAFLAELDRGWHDCRYTRHERRSPCGKTIGGLVTNT